MNDTLHAPPRTVSEAPESRDGPWRARFVPVGVFLTLSVASVTLSTVVRQSVADQERRLLDERSGAVTLLLTASFSGFTPSLPLLCRIAVATEESGGGFEQAAAALVTTETMAVGVAENAPEPEVLAAAGAFGPRKGEQLEGALLDLVRRAAQTGSLAVSLTDGPDGKARLLFALSEPVTNTTAFVLSDVDRHPPATGRTSALFSGLDLTLYAGTDPVPADLLVELDQGAANPPAVVVERRFDVAGSTWLLVAGSDGDLGGGLNRELPIIVLISGLIAAAMAAGIMEVLVRRRRYAVALVAQRTEDLEAALEQREHLDQLHRQARESADAANRSKSEFLSRMSHELRTPLNAVSGFAQLLSLEPLTSEQSSWVREIERGSLHLLDLINEVLDITRIETGALSLSPESVLVSEVVTEALGLVVPLARSERVNLVGGAPGACATHVFADRQRLKQILLNLLANAIKYNRLRGTVAVECDDTEPTVVRISVIDTGPGLTAAQLAVAFAPFERLGAEATAVEGSGIGLALSRSLAEAMRGTLDAASVVGQGSVFTITLPRVEGPVDRFDRLERVDLDRAAEPDEAPPIDRSGPDANRPATFVPVTPPCTVLYIEDNAENVRLVEQIVRRRPGTELVVAMQGALGVQLAREHQPGLVLLDLHLPDTPGADVLAALQRDDATRHIPVVILSADATPGQVERLTSAGAHAFLTKPLDVQELLDLIDTAARSAHPAG